MPRRGNKSPEMYRRKFGELFVMGQAGRNKKRGVLRYRCKCSCGEEVVVDGDRLRAHLYPKTTCGKNGHYPKMRCMPGRRLRFMAEYRVWARIKDRCYNKYSAEFEKFGKRGIGMSERWRNSFEHFLMDVGKRPTYRHQFKRIDPNGNYEPTNVEWRESR